MARLVLGGTGRPSSVVQPGPGSAIRGPSSRRFHLHGRAGRCAHALPHHIAAADHTLCAALQGHSNVRRRARRRVHCFAAETQQATDTWARAQEALANGEPHEGVVRGVNKGGILVDCWGINGFIPNSMLASSSARPEEGMRVKAMFVQVDELKNKLILSQKQVQQTQLLAQLKPDQEVEGKVAWLENYGAFVDIGVAEGHTVSGLIHRSELSWGKVIVPDTVVSVGEWVKCKVLSVDPKRGRVALSLKQLQPDPLTQNLETVMPSVDDGDVSWKSVEDPLPGLQAVVDKLLAVDGITEIKLGRQASLPGHVSQDLELWLSTKQVQDHWTVLARSMSAVQELAVYSTLDQAELKNCFDQVTKEAAGPDQSPAS